MIKVKTSPVLEFSEYRKYYIDRIGEFGSQTYECEGIEEVFQKVVDIAQMENVLSIYIWN